MTTDGANIIQSCSKKVQNLDNCYLLGTYGGVINVKLCFLDTYLIFLLIMSRILASVALILLNVQEGLNRSNIYYFWTFVLYYYTIFPHRFSLILKFAWNGKSKYRII